MDEIRIPLPNIGLSEIVKRKAKTTIDTHLTISDLESIAYQMDQYQDDLCNALDDDLFRIKQSDEKLIFISELLIYLSQVYDSVNSNQNDSYNLPLLTSNRETTLLNIQDIQYHLHSKIKDLGFKIDANCLTADEAMEISSKIDAIIATLDDLKGGHEILFQRIEELKEDFKDVLTTMSLGRKTTKQRFLGILAGYAGEKGADEVFSAIRPIITDILNDPTKLLGQ